MRGRGGGRSWFRNPNLTPPSRTAPSSTGNAIFQGGDGLSPNGAGTNPDIQMGVTTEIQQGSPIRGRVLLWEEED